MANSIGKTLPVALLGEKLLLHCHDQDLNLRPLRQHEHSHAFKLAHALPMGLLKNNRLDTGQVQNLSQCSTCIMTEL